MTPSKITGWKNYALAVICIGIGLWNLHHGNTDAGIKGLLAGAAIITLRDVLGKMLQAINANQQALNGLRAAIETELSRKLS
jgi:hypothetical protein